MRVAKVQYGRVASLRISCHARRSMRAAAPVEHVSVACTASGRDLEDDLASPELFDNGEMPTSEERETVAARLRRRRMQLRAEASGPGRRAGSERLRGNASTNDRNITSGVRRRRTRAVDARINVDLDAETNEDELYDVDRAEDEFEYDDVYEQEEVRQARRRDRNVYEAEYEDPYFGWGYGPAGNESWSEDGAGSGRRGNTDEKEVEDGRKSSTLSSGEYQDTTNLQDPPDIVILNPEELDRVLPVLPFSEQADFFAGGAAQAVQRWGASLALTVLFSKAALIAATSLTWPLWWPWAKAANKNFSVRSKVEYGGIWRTHILEVEKGNRPRPRFGEEEELRNMPRFSAMKTCTIVVGEENGAQTKLVLPFDARYEFLRPGQPAEVLVLSDSTSFADIKAIKDVYLPDNGMWLAEYPYIDRPEFLEVSLEIEREMGGEAFEDN